MASEGGSSLVGREEEPPAAAAAAVVTNGEAGNGPDSLEHINASELYPIQDMKVDDENLQVPFRAVVGESVLFLGRCSEKGVIALSNYRLYVRSLQLFINIPLGLIETVEYRESFHLFIFCKDAHSFRITFATNQICMNWCHRLENAILPPAKLQDTFAFVFHAYCRSGSGAEDGVLSPASSPGKGTSCNGIVGGGLMGALQPDVQETINCQPFMKEDNYPYTFGKEVDRLGFLTKKAWRISYINEKFEVSRTYPKLHIVPADVEDKDLKVVASFRACHRFPSVVWRHQRNGAVIARSSQPEVGWLGWRKTEDEDYLQAMLNACTTEQNSTESSDDEYASSVSSTASSNPVNGDAASNDADSKKMLIIDARSYTAAVANRAKGGGCECREYYPSCEIQFMSLANIHTIRKSFHALRTLCSAMSTTDQHCWLTGLEGTKWLAHMSALLRASLLVVHAVHTEARPVLIHCSDGWDRTPQISATAQLLMDPYYRTIEGFRMLVEREWLEFGHKFADRCGVGRASEDVNERCPVFLQWLDCVHQLLTQFPCAFQFNHAYLVKLAQHTYSCLFGTFLCNNVRERQENCVPLQTTSLWCMLEPTNHNFLNVLYVEDSPQLLQPSVQIRDLVLWRAVYLSESTTTTSTPLDPPTPSGADDPDVPIAAPLAKARSCENLGAETGGDMGPRRLSDPSLAAAASSPPPPDSVMPKLEGGESCNMNGHTEVDTVPNDVVDTTPDTTSDTASTTVVCQQPGSSSSISAPAPLTNGLCTKAGDDDELKDCDDDNDEHEDSSINHAKEELDSRFCDSSVAGEEESCSNGIANGHRKEGSLYGTRIGRSSVEGSTETLTGVSAECGQNSPNLRRPLSGNRSNAANMSTSTSEISDSHVTNGHLELESTFRSLSMGRTERGQLLLNGTSSMLSTAAEKASQLKVDVGRCQSAGQSTDSEASGSPSPAAEYKALSNGPRGGGSGAWWTGGGAQLDVDGLTVFADPVQKRMKAMEAAYARRIIDLERQLSFAKAALLHYASTGRGLDPETLASLDSEGGSSVAGGTDNGGEGSATSDAGSWEQVDETEAELTKWIPDHAATHCAVCHNEFWLARRKHHCRKCGRVFCSECSQNSLPLPEQQLDSPVRVCNRCYMASHSGGGTGSGGLAEECSSSPALLTN